MTRLVFGALNWMERNKEKRKRKLLARVRRGCKKAKKELEEQWANTNLKIYSPAEAEKLLGIKSVATAGLRQKDCKKSTKANTKATSASSLILEEPGFAIPAMSEFPLPDLNATNN